MPLSIITFQDVGTALKKPAEEVGDIGRPRIQKLIDEMIITMYEKDGIGLAAPQVNEGLRIAVLCPNPNRFEDYRTKKNEALILINPTIIRHSILKEESEEGCLSVPEFFGVVKRWRSVTVAYLDRFAKKQTVKGSRLFGYCLQHEIDHLDGLLFVDRTKKIYHAQKL